MQRRASLNDLEPRARDRRAVMITVYSLECPAHPERHRDTKLIHTWIFAHGNVACESARQRTSRVETDDLRGDNGWQAFVLSHERQKHLRWQKGGAWSQSPWGLLPSLLAPRSLRQRLPQKAGWGVRCTPASFLQGRAVPGEWDGPSGGRLDNRSAVAGGNGRRCLLRKHGALPVFEIWWGDALGDLGLKEQEHDCALWQASPWPRNKGMDWMGTTQALTAASVLRSASSTGTGSGQERRCWEDTATTTGAFRVGKRECRSSS